MLSVEKIDLLIDMNREMSMRLNKIEQSKYQAYADKKEFRQISGISATDIRDKLMKDDKFRELCVRRFGEDTKYYIHVEKALEYLERRAFKV